MAINYSDVATTDDFSTWLARTNSLLGALRDSTITAGSPYQNTTGNAQLFGIFNSSTLVATNGIRGGNVSTSAELTVTSNVDVEGKLSINGNNVINSTGYWVGDTTGLKGQKGEVGSAGSAGDKGDTGQKGQKGEVGVTGSTGSDGDKGDTGQKGQKGAAGSGIPAGSNTQVQYNDDGAFAGDANFTYDTGTDTLSVTINTGGMVGNTTGSFPSSNNTLLGNSTKRWALTATTGSFNANVTPTSNSTSSARTLGTTTSRWYMYANTVTASGDLTVTSDARTKDNIKTIENALDIITNLRGVSYTKDDLDHIGLIAQEVLPYVPEVVRLGSDDLYTLNYQNLVGLLINGIKELKQEIDQLKG